MWQESKPADLPLLRTLLQDPDASVPEAAALRIAELDGFPALRDLLTVFHRGIAEGHDHDNLQTILLDLADEDPPTAKRILIEMLRGEDGRKSGIQLTVRWLLDHVEEAIRAGRG